MQLDDSTPSVGFLLLKCMNLVFRPECEAKLKPQGTWKMAKVFVFGFRESAERRLQRVEKTSHWIKREVDDSFLDMLLAETDRLQSGTHT